MNKAKKMTVRKWEIRRGRNEGTIKNNKERTSYTEEERK